MKFVQNNKILEDSNAENAEISAEKPKRALTEQVPVPTPVRSPAPPCSSLRFSASLR